MNIAIVGGGHAALTLLDCFADMPDTRVVGVADLRQEAPGMVRARELGLLDDLFRAYANLTTVLDLIGCREEALEVAAEGIDEAVRHGLEAIYGNFLRGNAAESLLFLGRWAEAREMSLRALEWGPTGIGFFSPLLNLTTVDMEALVTRREVDLVIEITGIERVRTAITKLLRHDQEVMSATAAKIMYDVIELRKRQNQAASEHLSKEFRGFSKRLSGARESIDTSLEQVDKVLSAMKIVALNAKIEASRAGNAGRAFGVVAEEMKRMAANAQTALETIRRASTDTHETLGELTRAEKEMLSMFS